MCDVGRSRGSELCAAHPVSLGVHLSGECGPLQQQTPARLTQRNPAQRHRAVSQRSELHYICPCIVSSIKEAFLPQKREEITANQSLCHVNVDQDKDQ